jgi:hypothetical protein
MKRFLIIYIILISGSLLAQNNLTVRNNFEALKELYSKVTADICLLISNDSKNLNLKVSGDDNNFIVENLIREILSSSYNLNLMNPDSLRNLEIIQNTKVQYLDFPENNEKFIREIKCLVSAKLNLNGEIRTKNIVKTFSDTLNISEVQNIDYSKIYVNKENLTRKNPFDFLFQPVIILVSLGVFVYLLFSIRSN